MSIRNSLILMVGGIVAASAWVYAGGGMGGAAAESAVKLPAPAVDTPAGPQATRETAVFAGGCFWGVQAVFQHTQGVLNAVSGYAGGDKSTASYKMIGSGRTGHAEAVHITYDPKQVSYGKLLQIYFSVAHDPTQLNRQGPDSGTQYRSAIFTSNADQQRVAKAYIDQLQAAKLFPNPIVTQLAALSDTGFYPAEDYHQDYLDKHPSQPYIVMYDQPKIAALAKTFPTLYKPGKEIAKS
jgi:peptide-methionine (S)-S-oxide reductase